MAWADIVVSGLAPATARELDLTAEAFRRWNPRIVTTLVSPFGYTGPYRDWTATDLVLQAMGGVMQISGTADREPLKPGLAQSAYCAGINAAYASVAGHLSSVRYGEAVTVDLSVHEVIASQLVMNQPYYAFAGAVQGRRPVAQDPLSGEPIPTADGFVSLQSTTLTPVSMLAGLFSDDRFASPDFATEAPAPRTRPRCPRCSTSTCGRPSRATCSRPPASAGSSRGSCRPRASS
ncbi:hypothetical protein BJF78_23725 [Pseudonocardia sp. CNS-139]|nr:hypothetical protein BJF78_23725 [Pseudonocardia sp. CNS-139]